MVPMCYGLYKTLKTDYREERQQMQEAMAYDRQVEIRQMQEIMHPPPRRHVRVTDRQPTNPDENRGGE
jgi:choline-glycine betaine transporter